MDPSHSAAFARPLPGAVPPAQAQAMAARGRASAGWAVAALALATLQASLATSMANVALPTLARAFDATFHQVQWVVLAYLLATTALIVGAGRLGDAFGRRMLLMGGMAVFTAASLLCGLATGLAVLVAGRFVQGLGAALMVALSMALVADVSPKERLGRAMGMLGAMSAVGTALGPSLGGVLIAASGWRALFLVGMPLGLLTLLMMWKVLPADLPEVRAKCGLNLGGMALLAATVAAYSLAMTPGASGFTAANWLLLAFALFGALLFVIVQSRSAAPLIRLATIVEGGLGAGLAMNALATTVVMATLVVGPFYLSSVLALDPGMTGLVMSAGPLVAAMTGVPAGQVVERFGTHATALAGLGAMAVGSVALAFMPAGAGVAGYVGGLAGLTAGYALFQTANNSAMMRATSGDRRGTVSALLGLSRNLGLVTGASAMGALFAAFFGTGGGTGMRVVFGVACLLVAIAFVLALAFARPAGTPATGAGMSDTEDFS